MHNDQHTFQFNLIRENDEPQLIEVRLNIPMSGNFRDYGADVTIWNMTKDELVDHAEEPDPWVDQLILLVKTDHLTQAAILVENVVFNKWPYDNPEEREYKLRQRAIEKDRVESTYKYSPFNPDGSRKE